MASTWLPFGDLGPEIIWNSFGVRRRAAGFSAMVGPSLDRVRVSLGGATASGGNDDRIKRLEEQVAHLMRAVEDLSDGGSPREIDRLTRLTGMLAEREAGESGLETQASVRPHIGEVSTVDRFMS
jgi:hypothetical protein